jgi:hypothetical protein
LEKEDIFDIIDEIKKLNKKEREKFYEYLKLRLMQKPTE